MTSLCVRAVGKPAPTWWAHHCACAWVVAWLTIRERSWIGARELLESRRWSGSITWHDHRGTHQQRHRPDLIGKLGEIAMPFEVELTQKSVALRTCGHARRNRQPVVPANIDDLRVTNRDPAHVINRHGLLVVSPSDRKSDNPRTCGPRDPGTSRPMAASCHATAAPPGNATMPATRRTAPSHGPRWSARRRSPTASGIHGRVRRPCFRRHRRLDSATQYATVL